MSPIRKLGCLLDVDIEGYLINACDWAAIQSPWLELVNDLKAGCVGALGDRLHSLYLRGSVPRGAAIVGVSDLDSIVILKNAVSSELEEWSEAFQSTLERRYPFCRKVELLLIAYSEIWHSESSWQSVLQTQSLCIYGEDVRSQLPRFKPGIALVRHAFDLKDDLAKTQSGLRQLSPNHPQFEEQVKGWCGWITRRMIRTGFELVMEAEGTFTRDLYPCTDAGEARNGHDFSSELVFCRVAIASFSLVFLRHCIVAVSLSSIFYPEKPESRWNSAEFWTILQIYINISVIDSSLTNYFDRLCCKI
ncbi:MAG: hypothetical protein K6T90_05790 [Leptolyngbyaceae cyanobacterium HOT.MB2.61]|nr:hypothetical protein [Leptolyngbyaceae cyanobacterium HOT.MB2.61]